MRKIATIVLKKSQQISAATTMPDEFSRLISDIIQIDVTAALFKVNCFW